VTEYDIFEIMPDRSLLWRACTRSLKNANLMLMDFSKQSTNEFFAIHLLTNEIVARSNHESERSDSARMDTNAPSWTTVKSKKTSG
jgi:hypothetical protein